MEIIEGNNNNFDEEVLNAKTKVLVDFNATWCGPCRMLHPVLEELSLEHDEFKIVAIDVDEERDLALQYRISSIPCLILFENGKEVSRVVGFRNKEEILEFVGE